MADTDSPIIRPTTPASEYDGPPRLPLNRSSSSLSGLAHRGAERAGEDWSEPLVLLGALPPCRSGTDDPTDVLRHYRDVLRCGG